MNALSRRDFLRLTAAAAAGSVLAACAPAAAPAPEPTAEPKEEPEEAPEEEPTEVPEEPTPEPAPEEPVEMDYWYIWGGDGGQAMEEVSAQFGEMNPGVTINPLAAGGEILDKTIAAYAAGTPPDLVDLILCAPMAARDALISVEEYLEVSTVVDEDNFYDAQWDAVRYGGQRWGVPANEGLGWLGLLRNRGLVQEAGLDEEDLPTTWEELSDWADAMTEIDEDERIAVLGCEVNGMLMYPDCFGLVAGLRYFDGETNQYTYDDERWVEGLYHTKEFYDKVGPQNMADFRASLEGQAIASPTNASLVGLWNSGSWAPGSLALNAKEGMEWGVSFFIDGAGQDEKPFFAGTHTLMMLKGSEADLAWKFMEFSTTDEYIKHVYDVCGFIMGTKSFIASLDVDSLYTGLEFYTTGLEEGTRVWGMAPDPNWYLNLWEFLDLEEAVGFGTITPEEGLANLQQLATEELDKLSE
jgi:multiple sugar transport system substrate-binding protein